MELDELNVTFGNGRKVSGADDDEADDFEDIVHWLRTPLFEIKPTGNDSGNLIPSDNPDETEREQAGRPKRQAVLRGSGAPGDCALQ